MPLLPVTPPQLVPRHYGFDYVAVDGARNRVYAAHPSNSSLLVVDAASGKVLKSIHVGVVQGVAVNAHNGHVFTGDGIDQEVSEVDPSTGTVVRDVSVAGNVDALAYDAPLHRIYADEDDGTRVFVIDSLTMKVIGTVALPGHHPEYLAIDPQTHDVYQNIADRNEYVVIDPRTLQVKQTVATGSVRNNHPLQYDPTLQRIITGGDGNLALFDRHGKQIAFLHTGQKVDQCDLNIVTQQLACAGGGSLSTFAVSPNSITPLARQAISHHAHTTAIDAAADTLWTVWSDTGGEYVQGFRLPAKR